MYLKLLTGILIPFLGTSLGSACVFFMKNNIGERTRKILEGFAAGVMVSACFFSLIQPALEQSEKMGNLKFIPATVGFLIGILFLLVIDVAVPHLHISGDVEEGPHAKLKRTTMMVLAVTIHNVPEGMAVGVVYAGWIYGDGSITYSGALALALGIAIQNFPEGAIISMPLHSEGAGKFKTFWYGVLSGAVEPVGAILTILASGLVIPILPYLLSFAAGAMMYVVVEELIPEMSLGKHSNSGTLSFAAGFAIMMVLDVALG